MISARDLGVAGLVFLVALVPRFTGLTHPSLAIDEAR